jgi:hypothetical protein
MRFIFNVISNSSDIYNRFIFIFHIFLPNDIATVKTWFKEWIRTLNNKQNFHVI